MTKCTVPGCPGRVEDGFCGVCGMAPADVRPPDGPAPRQRPVPPTSGPQPSLGANSSANPLSGDPVHSHPLSGNVRLSGRSGPGSVSATSGASVSGAGRGSRRSSRGMLGMGMVQVPLVPYRDPSEAVMDNPVVAEKNRFCGNCGERVGRTQGDQPGRTEGFCRKCGTQFSFTPKLSPGDLVGGQYEVLGCLAHGGLGWIYLARDRNVNDRWVVLKGLLNAGDAEAHKAAAAERAFLSEVEHPNIVKIINFSQHPDPRTGIPGGHIVMEYVGGKSLRELLIERREDDPDAVLPPDQVIAYGLEVLRALGYLHSRGLLYCDFKPDNVIQSEEQIKLIDLGGVRRMDDTVSPVYTTPGYRVPEEELRGPGPTVSADLYSVGRALAVLSFRFSFMRDHPHSIPPRETVPLLQRHPSFDRLLRRATHSEPELRFHDAEDMADQLTGVLREVLSDLEGTPHPAPSTLFGAENPAARPDPGAHNADRMLLAPPPTDAAALLPAPLIDQSDPAAQHLRGFQTLPPEELVPALRAMPSPTPETLLMLVRALVTVGRQGEAMDVLQRFSEVVPGDWRTMWYLAVAELSTGRFRDARDHFDELYDHLPGELAPKLALALACERTGEHETAARLFRAVWNTDRSFVSAAFGLARIRLVQGDRAAATAVLDTVPELSRLHVHAQTALIAVLAAHHQGTGAADFVQAGRRLERIGLDGESADRLAVRVLESALGWFGAGAGASAGEELLGAPFTENGVRANLERRYRALAQRAVAPSERYELVDRANSLRPVTLL
ncbi:serine/threonine-protein kinase [Nocardiopsis dassonvillei]|uniref:non-specific serine/threonine protein kinase n=1 Tax=Nocardiopsis dassonvillei (strain ATCC 23218 / DSM 43111 / CIP 107115 / JCM 7437 / KCTC 9190 / NBRC 14626 / NCTC 10488 / NRRL B-5397 / IMRU 509) TaxID=446468 RepID=D7AX24_NOCDD|nr:serine/threonine-protein kinase [Nocardiopsis dassonvillei]ADH69794.1 serine/threonine protein kinase [Nocardiopsis dassonvillei subsp. dassonvillei DSM 43111]NKY80194.1 protein kinase [Nocardiopsis dassonvillei]VEI90306.1 Probable serine/threonine-protein kinase pknG [Nocardiopsis dassonvillei]